MDKVNEHSPKDIYWVIVNEKQKPARFKLKPSKPVLVFTVREEGDRFLNDRRKQGKMNGDILSLVGLTRRYLERMSRKNWVGVSLCDCEAGSKETSDSPMVEIPEFEIFELETSSVEPIVLDEPAKVVIDDRSMLEPVRVSDESTKKASDFPLYGKDIKHWHRQFGEEAKEPGSGDLKEVCVKCRCSNIQLEKRAAKTVCHFCEKTNVDHAYLECLRISFVNGMDIKTAFGLLDEKGIQYHPDIIKQGTDSHYNIIIYACDLCKPILDKFRNTIGGTTGAITAEKIEIFSRQLK